MSPRPTGRQPLVTSVVTVRGPLSAGDVAQLCREVDARLRATGSVVVAVEHCDLTVVDAVSRMRVLARRRGGRLELSGDRDLLTYCGLG